MRAVIAVNDGKIVVVPILLWLWSVVTLNFCNPSDVRSVFLGRKAVDAGLRFQTATRAALTRA
ncbi:MAG: hypothetical protein ACLSHC_00960 [Bilophila wadsworthia]